MEKLSLASNLQKGIRGKGHVFLYYTNIAWSYIEIARSCIQIAIAVSEIN
jgi:hypothetical protein